MDKDGREVFLMQKLEGLIGTLTRTVESVKVDRVTGARHRGWRQRRSRPPSPLTPATAEAPAVLLKSLTGEMS